MHDLSRFDLTNRTVLNWGGLFVFPAALSGGSMRFAYVSVAVGLILISASTSRCQLTGSITGVIVDPAGAPVSAATVTAKNLETGALRTSVSDDAGRYLLLSLPIGQYQVSAVKGGFQDA